MDLDKRMKEYYEFIPKTKLMRRTPVALRIDGKAFHTFTRGFKKPFDKVLMTSMQETMKYLCENIQGCVLGYTQSDEITLILVDYKKLDSGAWFDYEVQKMCSIGASLATMKFNQVFGQLAVDLYIEGSDGDAERSNYIETLLNAKEKGAMFDCRCFNIPKEEVTNLVFWRQQDAAKNSVQMVARAYFSDKQLKNKHSADMQDMLFSEHGINWNDFSIPEKRGTACIRKDSKWVIDTEMPILKGEARSYVDDLVFVGEE